MEELYKKVAYRTNLPEAQVKLVISHFWQAVKYHISNPLETKYGILINGFIKIKLRMRLVYRMVYKFDEVINPKYRTFDYNYWKDILEKLKQYGDKEYVKRGKKINNIKNDE